MSEVPAWALPEWAKKRACELANTALPKDDREYMPVHIDRGINPALTALARHVAEHEQEPVDPLLGEVQELADGLGVNLSAMPWVERVILVALKRGMELAKEQP